mmetsp:Transcript_77684/g.215254  ORF Transcript_77684/g.215254 Transcript_77684/m.215254 type:complete len:282 (+) Transcript_77684:472-1317(+)
MTLTSSVMTAPLVSLSTTRPTIHAGCPSAADTSAMKASALSAGRATSRPPLVSADLPCMSLNTPGRAASTATMPFRIGRVWISTRTDAFCASARLLAWPRMPKPVTSVAACAPYLCIALAPLRLRRHMLSVAASNARAPSSSVITSFTFSHSAGLCRHSCTLTAIWVPRGLVSTKTSPGRAPSGRMNSASAQTLFATPPTMGHGLSTVCPPVTFVPASSAQSLKPLIMAVVTMSRSSLVMSRLTPRIISIVSTSTTPMAYRSESTLQAATRPCRYGSSTNG